ncbi:MAG: hypothetical protein JWP87_1124 [Labilithrix sp.]|jgi:hypothetical protein|nr:hypothetical protein [Labilithrix sp.]
MLPFLPVMMDVQQQAYVQVRAEERIRTGNDVTAEETELQPQLRYDFIWKGGQNHLVAIYRPRFVYTHTFSRPTVDPTIVNPDTLNLTDPNSTPLSTLHNGGLGFEMVRPRYRISLYQFGAYGPITTTALLVQEPWGGDGPPPDPNPIIPSTIAARFTLLFLQTQFFAPIKLSRRVALIPGAVYNAFGGADNASRGVIALTSGPGASLALEVAATRADRFTTTIGAGITTIAFEGDRTGATIYRAEATQSWRHWYSRNISTEVLGGGSVGGDAISGYSLYSVASAGMFYDSYPFFRLPPGAAPQAGPPGHGGRVQVGLVVKATPWIDLFSGELEQRGVGLAAINYTIGKVTLRGQASSARVFNTPRSVAKYDIIQTDMGVRYALAPTFAVDGGLRYGFQEFSNAIRTSSITQTTAYAGLTWVPLPARF